MAVAKKEIVRQAVEKGLLVLHPSSSTYFLIEELLGEEPPTDFWVCGVICTKGLCIEMGSRFPSKLISAGTEIVAVRSPDEFELSWVIRKGKLVLGWKLKEILKQMGEGDVYVKGVNALDPQGNAGILVGNIIEGGTMGRVLGAVRERRFSIILLAGLEKLIPLSIEEAAKRARGRNYKYSTGLPCSLLPCYGDIVTEVQAFEILSNCKAYPIAAGGLGGAEGSIVMEVEGEDNDLEKAMRYVRKVKEAASLPQLRTFKCSDCPHPACPGMNLPD